MVLIWYKVFQPSDFTIINADKKFEFEQESQLTLADYQGRKLVLNLNYVKYPDSGGAFKVQIYSPFIVVNKTGLPFGVKCVRSAGVYREVAGPTNKGIAQLLKKYYISDPYLTFRRVIEEHTFL